jgi:hypothetical protein
MDEVYVSGRSIGIAVGLLDFVVSCDPGQVIDYMQEHEVEKDEMRQALREVCKAAGVDDEFADIVDEA